MFMTKSCQYWQLFTVQKYYFLLYYASLTLKNCQYWHFFNVQNINGGQITVLN